jgi:glycosyltransferase involved in cell wall biosynthesis
VFSDWVEGSKPYWDILVEAFRPEVIWGSFGYVDVFAIAKNLALRAGVRWVMDIKDRWEQFIPTPLKRILARRFMGAAALTVNSRFQAERSAPWFGKNAEVVYSGGPSDLIADDSPAEEQNGFQITLVGGTYGTGRLEPFIEALRKWLTRRLSNERLSITFAYAGGDSEMVKRVCEKTDLCHVEIYGYLPIIRMMKLCAASAVNCYLWSLSTFHHKLIELLFCRRPIIAFPGEYTEAMELAHRVGGELHVCGNSISVCDTLEKLWECRLVGRRPGNPRALQEFTWDSQAAILEQTLRKVITDVF